MDNDDYTAKMTELIELLRVIGNDTQQCEVKECKRRISSPSPRRCPRSPTATAGTSSWD